MKRSMRLFGLLLIGAATSCDTAQAREVSIKRAALPVAEARRDSRRLHSLRGWGHGTTEQVFPGGSRAIGTDGS
jgi:hypothetical protein